MAKEQKTNAMRILDKNKIPYQVLTYECDNFIDGIHCAKASGAPIESSYKTLVMCGKSKNHYVIVLPIAKEVDMKAAARAVKEKSVEMIHVKDIQKITGYIRGGCSPIGMRKQFTTVYDSSIEQFEEIYVSGGRIGCTLKMAAKDLIAVTGGITAPITE